MPRSTGFGGSFDIALISATEQSRPSMTPLFTLNFSFLAAYSSTFLAAAMASSKPKAMPVGPMNKSAAGSAGVPFAAILLRVFLTTLYSAPASFRTFLSSATSDTVSPLYSVRTTAFDFENFSDSSAICWDFLSLVIRFLPPFPETRVYWEIKNLKSSIFQSLAVSVGWLNKLFRPIKQQGISNYPLLCLLSLTFLFRQCLLCNF